MDELKISSCDQMDAYANELSRDSSELKDLINRINSQAHRSMENWNDRSSNNFMKELDEQKKLINAISGEMERFAQYVHRKAEQARRAANQN